MATRIRLRRDTTANWATSNPVLGLGEVGIEVDSLTTPTVAKAKVGDGTRTFSALPYLAGGSVDGASITGTVPDARIASTIARDSEVTAAIAALSSVYQPVDSDLTAIAALTTTTFGRALLTQADAAATRTTLGLGTAATQATSAFEAAGAVAAAASSYQPVDSDLTAIAALTTTTFGRSLLTQVDAAAVRTTLGLGTAATQASTAFDAAGAATTAVTTHTGATDPHGDRAYAVSLVDDLSGVTSPLTARANLGLGPLATASTIDYSTAAPYTTFTIKQNSDGSWPGGTTRPSSRTDVSFIYKGYTGLTGGPTYGTDGDLYIRTP